MQTKAQISMRNHAAWSVPLLFASKIVQYRYLRNQTSKTLASLFSWAGGFESYLVTNLWRQVFKLREQHRFCTSCAEINQSSFWIEWLQPLISSGHVIDLPAHTNTSLACFCAILEIKILFRFNCTKLVGWCCCSFIFLCLDVWAFISYHSIFPWERCQNILKIVAEFVMQIRWVFDD